jgi:hypothetical protein
MNGARGGGLGKVDSEILEALDDVLEDVMEKVLPSSLQLANVLSGYDAPSNTQPPKGDFQISKGDGVS